MGRGRDGEGRGVEEGKSGEEEGGRDIVFNHVMNLPSTAKVLPPN